MHRKTRKFLSAIPPLLSLASTLCFLYAGWLSFVLQNQNVPVYTLKFSQTNLSIPQQAVSYAIIALLLWVGSKALASVLRKLVRSDNVYLLNHSGATWKIKDLVATGKENEAVRFVRQHYDLSQEEAQTMVEKIRFGIDTTQAFEDDSEIDLDEKTLTNFESLPSSGPRKKIVIDPKVAATAKEMMEAGKVFQALKYLQKEQSIDLETAKLVLEKLKKTG